jgi:hypothetical protein
MASKETGYSDEESEAEVGQIRFPWLRADAWLDLLGQWKKRAAVAMKNCDSYNPTYNLW